MSIATQIGRIAKAKKDIKEVVNQDFEIINNETIDKYAEKMGTAYDEYESYIPWEHGEGSEFTFKKGGAGSYLKELEINGNTHQTTIVAETGEKVIDTTINVNDVNTEKENYVTLNGNTHQDSYTGKNLLNIPDGSIVNQGVTVTRNNNVITFSGTATGTYPSTGSFPFTIAPGTYTISSTNNNYDFFLWFRNSNSDLINSANLHKGTKTITITSNNITALVIGVENLTTGTTYNIETSIQIEEGSTATDIEPFVGGSSSPSPDFPQQIEVVTGDNTINVHGKNLFDNVYGQTENVYTTHINANNPLGSVNCYPINLLPNTQYTLKVDMNGYQKTNAWITGMCFANGDTISLLQLGSMADVTTTTFTTDSTGVVYVGQRYGFTYGETGRMNLFLQTAKIQIEQGSTTTEYQPYQSKDYEISLGDIELCKIGDYKDYIYKENDKWYLHKEIGKVVLDGSENWIMFDTGTANTSLYGTNVIDSISIIPFIGLSNYFINSPTTLWASDYEGLQMSSSNTDKIRLRINKTIAPDVATLKNWLSTHNVEVYYVLATPTYETITNETLINQLNAIEKLNTYENYTVVTATGDLINPELECVLFSQPAYQK